MVIGTSFKLVSLYWTLVGCWGCQVGGVGGWLSGWVGGTLDLWVIGVGGLVGRWTHVLWLCLGLQLSALVKRPCRWLCHLWRVAYLHVVGAYCCRCHSALSPVPFPCIYSHVPCTSPLRRPAYLRLRAHSLLHSSPNLRSPSMHPWPVSLLPWPTCSSTSHRNVLLVLDIATCCLLLMVDLLVVYFNFIFFS